MKKKFLSLVTACGMLCGFLHITVPVNAEGNSVIINESDIPLQLYYDEEASHGVDKGFEDMPKSTGAWIEYVNRNVDDDWERWSIPIGNGIFGANLFGRTETERIQLTDKTMQNPYRSDPDSLGGLNNFSETYIDFGHENANVTNYSRELDLKTAISTVQYTHGGVNYKREYFASYPDNALIIKLEASAAGALDFVLRPTVPYEQEYAQTEGDRAGKTGKVASSVENGVGKIVLSGKMEYYDIDFAGIYKIYTDGTGEISATTCTNADGDTDGTITVMGAKTAYIVVTLGTDYVLDPDIFLKPDLQKPTFYTDLSYTMDVVEGRMNAVTSQLSNKTADAWYETLKGRHLADYQKLFGRVTLNIDCKESDFSLTTDQLLANYKNGSGSTYLETLYFQYGRYLLIASSREGGMPANLQGTWNRYNFTPYSGGYWHNINVQMNYWPAFSTNLAETFIPYIDYNAAYMPRAEQAATDIVRSYTPELDGLDGGNGWTIGTGCKVFTIDTSRLSGDLGLTTQLFWDSYRYTGDRKYLEEKVYPLLASAARYITKSVTLQEDGTYLVLNSPSPEQFAPGTTSWYFSDGTAYAQSATYMNNYYCLQAAREMGIDLTDESLLEQEEYQVLKTVLRQIDKYDPIQVGLSGQVKEFREEKYYGEIGEYKHRHISQLIGLYPGEIINSTTPAWLDAAKVTLTERGDETTGWGVAHRLNLWARTKDGNRTYKLVEQLLKRNTATNLWDLHPPFQIDGNFGGTAGIAEMLLQSHEGYISPLSAIPDKWASGSYTGLKARGNFEVAAKWENGRAKTFHIKSNDGNKASVFYFGIENAVVKTSGGATVNYEITDKNLISFDTVSGETYIISNLGTQKKLSAPAEATAERNLLDPIFISWSDVTGADSYNVYAAADNAPDYTLIQNTKNLSYRYTPEKANINSRFTFKIVPVSADGTEGYGKICYQNPADIALKINSYTAGVIGDTQLQVTVDATPITRSYRLWKKAAGAADYTLLSESDYPIIIDAVYSAEASYGISLIGLYGDETQITPITKFVTTGGIGQEVLPEYRRNFLTDYTFEGAEDALRYVLNNMGYSRLTDGKHKVDSDIITYRFATLDSADSYMDGTVSFDKEYILDELRLYDYDQLSSTTTRAGDMMDVYVLQSGEWMKAKSFASSAELIAARQFDTTCNAHYTAVDLKGYCATAIRIVCRNVTSTMGATFYEIECSGTAIYEQPIADEKNVFSGLSPESYTANTDVLSGCGIDKLTDGDFGVSSGRLAVNDGANNALSVTYDLGRTYFLKELKVYEHVAESATPDVNETESGCSETTIEIYRDGRWEKVMDGQPLWSAESELITDNDGKYASISLGGKRGSKLRMTFKNIHNTKGISLYEIKCMGGISVLESPGSNAFDNYVSITQTGAIDVYSADYKLENALDGDMSTRFAIREDPIKDFYVEVDLGTEKPLFNLVVYDFGDYKDVIDGVLTTRSDDTYVELYSNGTWIRAADGVELDVTDHVTEFYLFGITASKIRIGFSTPEFTIGAKYHHASVYEMTCSTAATNAPDRSGLLMAYKDLCDLGLADISQCTEKMSVFKTYVADTDADQGTIDAYTKEMTAFADSGIEDGIYINNKTYDALIKTDIAGAYKIIFALYDSNQALLDMETADITLTDGFIKVAKPESLAADEATVVKVMVWADLAASVRPILPVGVIWNKN